MAPIVELVLVTALPVLTGAAAKLLGRPWWWGAFLAIAMLFLYSDALWFVVVLLYLAALAWLGAWAARRLRRSG